MTLGLSIALGDLIQQRTQERHGVDLNRGGRPMKCVVFFLFHGCIAHRSLHCNNIQN